MITGNNRVRSDVYDEALDEKMAPSLGGVVLGIEHEMYVDAEKFFERTLVTEQMVNILENILNVLKGESGKKILVLNALYGGGKTHTLLAIYHALKTPHALLKAFPENEDVRKRISRFVEEIGKLGRPDLVVVDGYYSELAPSPISPLDVKAYKVRTIWGYIAHVLGSYSILRENDEKQVAPEASKLLEILKNRSVVILIDEIAHYIKRFYETPDENLRRYSLSIETFMEALAKAIELAKNAILVISIPAEMKGEIRIEITYQEMKRSIEKIFKALARVYTEYVEPIAPRNIPALLRVRLFEGIDERRSRDIYEILSKTYRENKEIFGEQVGWMGEALKTYPFHPLYVKTLVDILDKHEYLQKTRDLLRISRKVLREVLRDKKPYDLIMPWHIDLTRDPIRNTLLVGEYEGFKLIVEEDINGRVKLFGERQLLAKITALALLAKTFVYGGGLIPKVEVFPSEGDLAQMVYEPATFQTEGWAPKDIVDSIRWISKSLLYVVMDEKTGRLWFTRYVTPIRYVEERAGRVDDMLAIDIVLKHADALLRRTADDVVKGRKQKAITSKVFNVEQSQALKQCEPVDIDTRKYVLLACLDVPENENERRVKLEEVLYRTKSGGTRRYANTIYVVFPSSRERIKWVLDYAKKLIACEEVEKEGIIEKLARTYQGKEAEIAKEVLGKKLDLYKTDVLEELVNNTLSIFDRIAFPYYNEGRLVNTVKEIGFMAADSIVIATEKSLSQTGVGKLKTDMDFDLLDYYLRSVGIDISNGPEPKIVEEIVDYFYTNPRLPAVPREVIIEAIKDGVKRLEVGVRSRGRVYFKRIYEHVAPQVSEGEVVATLDDDDEILPWRITLQEHMKTLRRREWSEGGVRKVEEYVVKIGEEGIAVEEVLSNIGKFNLELLRTAPVVKIIRTASVKIELAEQIVEVKPGETVSLDVYIARIGPYTGEILIKPSTGNVDKERLRINDAFTKERVVWTIGEAPQMPKDYVYTLEVIDSQGVLLDTTRVTVRVPGEKPGWSEGVPPAGTRIQELEVKIEKGFSLKPLEVLRKRLGGTAVVSRADFRAEMRVVGSRVVLDIYNVQIDDVLALVMTIINRFQLFVETTTLSLNLRPAKDRFFTMPEMSEDDRKVLEGHWVRYLKAEVAG